MVVLLFLTYICFFGILIYFQKKDQNYIGYTTVLMLLFGLNLVFALLVPKLFSDEIRGIIYVLILSNWILGSVIIYITSQLTLAFEKISQLSRHIAIKELERETKS